MSDRHRTTLRSPFVDRQQKRVREQLRDAIEEALQADPSSERDKRRRSIRQYLDVEEAQSLLAHIEEVESRQAQVEAVLRPCADLLDSIGFGNYIRGDKYLAGRCYDLVNRADALTGQYHPTSRDRLGLESDDA